MSTLTTVLPALTGFGGTLLGIAVAEARARRDARLSRGSDFAARRKAAYAELWTVVQDARLEAPHRD
jgi:hypothetical protein